MGSLGRMNKVGGRCGGAQVAANFFTMCPALAQCQWLNFAFTAKHDLDRGYKVVADVNGANSFCFSAQHCLHTLFDVQGLAS